MDSRQAEGPPKRALCLSSCLLLGVVRASSAANAHFVFFASLLILLLDRPCCCRALSLQGCEGRQLLECCPLCHARVERGGASTACAMSQCVRRVCWGLSCPCAVLVLRCASAACHLLLAWVLELVTLQCAFGCRGAVGCGPPIHVAEQCVGTTLGLGPGPE